MIMHSFKKKILYIAVSFLFITTNYSQSVSGNDTFLNQNLIITVGSGFSYGFTDYKNSILEPLIRGSIEYYPVSLNNARIGLKIFGGGTRLSFSDDRGIIRSNDNPALRYIPSDIYTDIIQIGGLLNLGISIDKSIIPYIGVGFSYLNFSPKSSDGHRLEFNRMGFYDKQIFSFALEGGIKYQISDRFSLDGAIAYYPTTSDYLDDISASKSKDSFLSGLIGISYAFIGESDSDGDGVYDNEDMCPDTPRGVKVDEFGCPIDSDKDGIPDFKDQCPDTPTGVKVNEFGCPLDSDNDGVPDYLDKCPGTPLGIEVNSDGCPPDKDNDGVPDYLDKCPDTPKDVKVDKNGCPLDSDKDGVPDYKDKCPGTPANTKVDSTGCPEGTSSETFYQFILRGDDTFNNNSSSLKDGAKLLLNEIAFYIQNQPDTKWRIEGHMDSQGSVSLIKRLSYDRAKTVLEYLVSQGISADRLTVYGLGDSFPIANNNTEEGRSTNRRILIIRED